MEVVVPLPDRTLYFLAKANLVRDETGNVVLNLTHATDITARKQVEDALLNEKYLQLLLRNYARTALATNYIRSSLGPNLLQWRSPPVSSLYLQLLAEQLCVARHDPCWYGRIRDYWKSGTR